MRTISFIVELGIWLVTVIPIVICTCTYIAQRKSRNFDETVGANLRSAWVKHISLLTLSQTYRLLMLKAALSILTKQAISVGGILIVIGCIWLAIKFPQFVQIFARTVKISASPNTTV